MPKKSPGGVDIGGWMTRRGFSMKAAMSGRLLLVAGEAIVSRFTDVARCLARSRPMFVCTPKAHMKSLNNPGPTVLCGRAQISAFDVRFAPVSGGKADIPKST
jgi:hypothetical protein